MSGGEGKVHWEFMVNVSPPRSPCSIHPAHAWQQVLPGCKETPTQCIWISHTCPVSSAGHRWRNKPTWAKKTGEKAGEGGCAEGQLVVGVCFTVIFISLVVKFIYQLSILCFVSLLYAHDKVTINSICECIKMSPGSFSYFPSSSDFDIFWYCVVQISLVQNQKIIIKAEKSSSQMADSCYIF